MQIPSLLLKYLSLYRDNQATCKENQKSMPTTNNQKSLSEEETQLKVGRQLHPLPDLAAQWPHTPGAPAIDKLLAKLLDGELPGTQHLAESGSSQLPKCHASPNCSALL